MTPPPPLEPAKPSHHDSAPPPPPAPPCDAHDFAASTASLGFSHGRIGGFGSGSNTVAGTGFKFGGGTILNGAVKGKASGRLPNKMPLKPPVAAFRIDSDEDA